MRHGSRCANHSTATKHRTHFSWAGCFCFSARSLECLRLSRAPGCTSVFYRDLAEDLSALSRQSAEISCSPNVPLRARSQAAPRVASTGRIPVATKSAATGNLPGRRVRWPPSPRFWDRTRSEPPGPRLCVLGGNVTLGVGVALSDQLSVIGFTITFGPVKSLLTFPSSATEARHDEAVERGPIEDETASPSPAQAPRQPGHDAAHTKCVSSPDNGNKDIGLKRRCWRWSPRPCSARQWQEQR